MKNTNSKMTTNSQQLNQQLNLKKKHTKQTTEQEQNHKNEDHRVGYPQGEGWRKMGGKVQGIRSINGRYKIGRGRLRIVQEMEKSKNLYV